MNTWLTRLKVLLPKSSFTRNVAVLTGGTAAGQAMVVLASPILTRLYTPEDFGVLAVYSSVLSIVSVVASLRYELAIPLAEDDETAANLLLLSLTIGVGVSLLTGILTWLLGDQIVTWTNTLALKPYLC
ncbi:MAG: lipopolysaccharide biosynthesis protein, partial [Moorellaceae bacterium]